MAKRLADPERVIYNLDGQGCTVAKQADIGWFLAQGFSSGPPFAPTSYNDRRPEDDTVQIGTLPASTYIGTSSSVMRPPTPSPAISRRIDLRPYPTSCRRPALSAAPPVCVCH